MVGTRTGTPMEKALKALGISDDNKIRAITSQLGQDLDRLPDDEDTAIDQAGNTLARRPAADRVELTAMDTKLLKSFASGLGIG